MKTETKILGIILILTAVLLFGGIFLLSRSSGKTANDDSIFQIDYSKGQKIGSDSAKVKLVEFSDFQCPACAVAESYLKKLRSIYPGQLQMIYRHFPLPQHQLGRQAAILAEAAGEQGNVPSGASQGKFWEMHDKLFETQAEWSKLTDTDANAFFMDLAKQLELDENKIKKALEENTFKSIIDEDMAEGYSLKVNSTPTFFLNGRKLILQKFDDLGTLIEQELKK